MIIGGLEKFSLIDYPEHLSAIVFAQGCNFRCHFCYNPMLVVPPISKREDDDKLQNNRYERLSEKSHPAISEDGLFLFLESRRGKLDGVVLSGGEPTLQKDLPEFIGKIKAMGFKVKLDTNGTNPAMLKRLLIEGLLDYVAMDIKSPLDKYPEVVNFRPDPEKIKESIALIMDSGLPYEFRTTIVRGLHAIDDIVPMAEMIKGAKKWYLQKFQGETPLIDNTYMEKKPHSDKELREMVDLARKFVQFCAYR